MVGVSLQADTLKAFHLHAPHRVFLSNVCPGPLVVSGCVSCRFNTELPESSLIDPKSQLTQLSAGIGACC